MSSGEHGEKGILDTGRIIVFVKNSSNGSRIQVEVLLEWLGSSGGSQSLQNYPYGRAVFQTNGKSGIYRITVGLATQYGYMVDNNDEGYHTFLVP